MTLAPSELRYALASNMAACGIPMADMARMYQEMMRLGFTATELRQHGAQARCRAVEIRKEHGRLVS